MPKSVILDVDTGVDDAFALLYAVRHPDLNVLGITCVDGNTHLDQVCANTLYVIDAAGAGNIPVAAGARHPLMGSSGHAEHVHGNDGLGGHSKPVKNRTLDKRHAVELIKDLVNESAEPVTLIPVGPLTNIALFIATYPEVAKKLEGILLMGGSAGMGNVTATAEFNIWHDPEAAHVVFNSGLPITMYGLDVFYELSVSQAHVDDLRKSPSSSAQLAADLVEFRYGSMGSEITLGDYGAVASFLYPELTTSKVMNVAVDVTNGLNRGQTICDKRPNEEELYPNQIGKPCKVILTVQKEEMVKRWVEVVK
jgi:pyrimidine-specific ribonucleoside hydrolase